MISNKRAITRITKYCNKIKEKGKVYKPHKDFDIKYYVDLNFDLEFIL